MPREEDECRHVFCYGSLRPDDNSGMPWTKEAVAGMTAQPAKVPGAKLYMDTYAALVFDENDNGDDDDTIINNNVTGWVLTTADPAFFRAKLERFDEIEAYREDGSGYYQRTIVDVCLDRPERTIGGDPIGATGSVVKAYVYHRPECSKDNRIASGDWLLRDQES